VQAESNRQYNTSALEYLAVTQEIFKAYADGHFTITANEVPNVLTETYEVLGRHGYKPNEEDVRVWMKLCDSNGDGHVEYE
jgi:Ca2+-binding EF-hand superfamily protein